MFTLIAECANLYKHELVWMVTIVEHHYGVNGTIFEKHW